jgi:putative transposase
MNRSIDSLSMRRTLRWAHFCDGGRFTSAILPRFMRRTPSVDALIPALYLKGISTGDFTEALAAILGQESSGLSATNIVRLKAG